MPCCHCSHREWTRLLCVLLAVQCPLQMRTITQPPVCYIHTAVLHSPDTLRCTISCPHKIVPLVEEESGPTSNTWFLGPTRPVIYLFNSKIFYFFFYFYFSMIILLYFKFYFQEINSCRVSNQVK